MNNNNNNNRSNGSNNKMHIEFKLRNKQHTDEIAPKNTGHENHLTLISFCL